jgi:hypothetical protein
LAAFAGGDDEHFPRNGDVSKVPVVQKHKNHLNAFGEFFIAYGQFPPPRTI